MNHLDEGTIHAWLDGALDSTQAREIETHVAQCATCSAAVAEARGFVAGASRILNALDDVPANVVPKRAPTPPTARRQWRAAPWVTGIAAVLILAIGLTQVSRKGAQETVFMPATTSAILADSAAVMAESPTAAPVPLVQPPPQTSGVQSAATAEGRVAAAAERQERRDRPRDEKQSASRDLARRSESTSDAVQMRGLRAPAGGAAQGGGASSQSVPAAPSQSVQNAPVQQKLEQVVVTAAPDAMKSAPAFDAGADAKKAQVERLAGCYRLDAPTSVIVPAAPPSVGNVTGAAVQRAAKARAQVSEAPTSASFAAGKAPGAVRLDTVQHPIGFLVRAERSDSVLGSWRIAGDSARLDLASGLRFVVTQSHRVSCPER